MRTVDFDFSRIRFSIFFFFCIIFLLQVSNIRETAATRNMLSSSTLETPIKVFEFGSSPRIINGNVGVIVKRPKTSRTGVEKDNASEVLVVNGIEFKDGLPGRVDVYVTTETNKGEVGAEKGDLAGSYVNIPHGKPTPSFPHNGQKHTLNIGITELLEIMNVEDAEYLVVTLVCGHHGEVTVDGIHIELVDNPKE